MGKLIRFDIENIDCNVYVETGIGRCDSFRYAQDRFDPKNCYGLDLDLEFVALAKSEFPRSNIYHGTSTAGLEHWFKTNKFKQDDRVLFFLDAHFPGSDYRGMPYDTEAADALPLREELLLIKRYRPGADDIIICDDARIYYDGPFAHGNTCYRANHGIEDIFPDKKIMIDYHDEGYIIIGSQILIARS